MPPYNAMVGEGTFLFLKRLELARELDPMAFEPTMIAHYFDEQLERQRKALAQVEREHPELMPQAAKPAD